MKVMKQKGKNYWNRLIIILVAVAYASIVLIAKEDWNKTQFIFFVFTLLSFCFALVKTFISEDKANGNVVFKTVDSVIFSIYFLIQFIAFGIFGVSLATFSFVTGLVLEIIITVIGLVLNILINSIMEHSSGNEESDQNQVANDRLLVMRLSEIKTKDPTVRSKCSELARLLQNGFPIYPKEVSYITQEIVDSINELEDLLLSDATIDALSLIDKLESLIKERATKAKIYRR